MTADLFEHYGKDTPLIVSVKEVKAEVQATGMVALRATILNPDDLTPSGTEIVVQMLPVDASEFAATVQGAAKRDAWKFPSDAKFVKWHADRSIEKE
jgi:hypothetical protein